ncbi:MAG TPA: peptidoglycan-binding domain-containing protein [Candidatus Sulfotelmatobacter sp.]|nr:peptidoglycan-binding domain-containing protein [Candidatus Sulfotelmatobacter sp.]
MLLANKAAWAGIASLLLMTGISGSPRTTLASESNLSKEVSGVGHRAAVNELQEALRNKGHYRGQIDGVLGLRTRASIRAYQKAENLPVTGNLDNETAGRLGVRPEVREERGFDTTQNKPTAGTKWAKGSGPARKTPQKPVNK